MSKLLIKWSAWISPTLLWALPVLAADDAHSEGGSPDLFTGSFGQSFWAVVIFILVVLVLGKFAWGPMLAGLQKREAFIRDSLASAKRDREASEARLKEYEERLMKAREEASAIVEEARRDAEATAKRIEAEARDSAKDELDRAKREIGIARDTALKDLYDQSAELAMTMATTVLKRELSPADHKQLLQDTLSQIRDKGVGTN